MMEKHIKIMLIWSGVNLLISPLVGYGLAYSDLPSLVSAYAMVVIFMSPLCFLGASALWK